MGGFGEVVMRRFLSLVVICVLVAACGGAGGPAAPTDGADVSSAGPGATIGGAEGSGGKPSGAKVRIVNAYNGGATAASIDVYAAPWVLDGATPLLSVPYGTATDFFDPTVIDDQGDMSLSFYRHGETGNGTELIGQTETLKGGEIITYVLMSDAKSRDDGTPRLFLQSLYHSPAAGSSERTPDPGKGILIVNMHGIEPAISPPSDGSSWFLSAGEGCKLSINDSADTLTAAGPGDGTRYQFDPGDYAFSLHQSTVGEIPTCASAALVANMKATIEAGKTTLLVVYAPSATEIKTMALPLGY